MDYERSTLYLNSIGQRLKVLDMPVYYELPKPDVLEPFIVIGTYNTNNDFTAKNNALIEHLSLQVDVYLPATSRTKAEEIRSKAVKALKIRKQVTTQLLKDNSIGRETYHIVLRSREII